MKKSALQQSPFLLEKSRCWTVSCGLPPRLQQGEPAGVFGGPLPRASRLTLIAVLLLPWFSLSCACRGASVLGISGPAPTLVPSRSASAQPEKIRLVSAGLSSLHPLFGVALVPYTSWETPAGANSPLICISCNRTSFMPSWYLLLTGAA